MREERNMTKVVFLNVCRLFVQGENVGHVAGATGFSVTRIDRCKKLFDKSRLKSRDEIAWELFECEKRRHRLHRKLNAHKITGAKGKSEFESRPKPKPYPSEIW